MNTNKTQTEQLTQFAVMQSVLKAYDCRYGNYIEYGGSITQLNEKEMCHFFRFPESYKPIPLTKEWLIRLSFEKITDNIYKIYDGLFININGKYWESESDFYPLYPNYVHQLQNLYFALTERDLTVA